MRQAGGLQRSTQGAARRPLHRADRPCTQSVSALELRTPPWRVVTSPRAAIASAWATAASIVVDHRTGFAARGQAAIGFVAAIGECFVRDAEAGRVRRHAGNSLPASRPGSAPHRNRAPRARSRRPARRRGAAMLYSAPCGLT